VRFPTHAMKTPFQHHSGLQATPKPPSYDSQARGMGVVEAVVSLRSRGHAERGRELWPVGYCDRNLDREAKNEFHCEETSLTTY